MAEVTGSDAWKSMFGDAASSAGPEPVAKARAVAAGESGDTAAKADLALRLSVINAQQMRMVLAIVTMSFAIPVSGEVFKVLEASKASYIAMTKGKKGHGKAPPDVYNFIALLLLLTNHTTSPQQKEKIDAFISGHGVETKRAWRDIKACRTEKMFDSSMKRLYVQAPAQILELVADLLVEKFDALEHAGQRPAGYLESQGQKLLNPQ